MAEEKNTNENNKKKKKFKIPGKEAVSKLLGRFKKKKQEPASEPDGEPTPKPEKKKFFTIKKLIVMILLLGCVAASGFAVYKFYFQKKDGDAPPKYKLIKLEHVKLADEILEFSFYNLTKVYDSLIEYNNEILVIDIEIKRIEDIAKKYPDHKKIPDKEKKIWDKTRANLIKNFDKIQAAVKTIFVLYSVDKEQGLAKIKEKKEELISKSTETLNPVKELTKKLPPLENIPDNSFMGIIEKIKKKFL